MSAGKKGEDSAKKTGIRYEQTAADFLQTQGFKILERNFRCPAGEIDVIAQEGEYLCFLEVKFRKEENEHEIEQNLWPHSDHPRCHRHAGVPGSSCVCC